MQKKKKRLLILKYLFRKDDFSYLGEEHYLFCNYIAQEKIQPYYFYNNRKLDNYILTYKFIITKHRNMKN